MASAATERITPTTAAASNCAEDESSSSGELIDRSDDEIVFESTSMSAAGLEESGKEEIASEGAELNSATIQQTPTPQSVAIPSSTESEQYEFVSSGGFDGDVCGFSVSLSHRCVVCYEFDRLLHVFDDCFACVVALDELERVLVWL